MRSIVGSMQVSFTKAHPTALNLVGFPNSSNGGELLKVDSKDEKIRNSDRIAMDWPGHSILSNPLMGSSWRWI